MVRDLFATPGAGQDETVFKFASDVNVDQTTEIARMERMLLAGHAERAVRCSPCPTHDPVPSEDPAWHRRIPSIARPHAPCALVARRRPLAAVAPRRVRRLARRHRRRAVAHGRREHVRHRAQPRPARRPARRHDGRGRGDVEHARRSRRRRRRRSSSAAPTPTSRSPATTRSRATTTASRSGTSRTRAVRTLTTAYYCPASQSDVSVYKNLLFVSGEGLTRPPRLRRRRACATRSARDRLRGIRIFDITDIANPKQRRQRADLPRLAHAHGARGSEGQGERLHLHLGLGRRALAERAARLRRTRRRQDPNSALFRIEVIKVPLAHPEQAAIVSSPRIFNDLDGAAAARRRAARTSRGDRGGARARGAFIATVNGDDVVLAPRFVTPLLDSIVKARGGTGAPTGADSAALRGAHPRASSTRMFGERSAPNAEPRRAPTQCHDITVYPGDRPGRRRVRGLRPAARHQRPGQPDAHRRGRRLELLVLALGDVQQRRHQGPVHRRVGRRRRSRSAAPSDPKEWGADAIFTLENGKLKFQSYYKLPARADARRRTASRTTARSSRSRAAT